MIGNWPFIYNFYIHMHNITNLFTSVKHLCWILSFFSEVVNYSSVFDIHIFSMHVRFKVPFSTLKSADKNISFSKISDLWWKICPNFLNFAIGIANLSLTFSIVNISSILLDILWAAKQIVLFFLFLVFNTCKRCHPIVKIHADGKR